MVRQPRSFGPLWIFAVVALVFSRTLVNGWLEYDDDVNIFANPLYHPVTLTSVGQLWTTFVTADYNPVVRTLWAAIALMSQDGRGGILVFPFHLLNLVLHAFNAVLVFWLLRRLLEGPRQDSPASSSAQFGAAAGALWWALHPLQVEPVAWITGGRDLLSTAFGLSALLLTMRWVVDTGPSSTVASASRNSAKWLGAAAVLYALAVFSKTSAVTLPVLAFSIAVFWARRPVRQSWPFVAVALAVMVSVARLKLLAEAGTQLIATPLWFRPVVSGDALAFYAVKIAWPWPLVANYGRTPAWLLAHPNFWPAAILTWFGLATLAWKARGNHQILLPLVFFLFPLLPVLGLVPFTYQDLSTVADRYAYLALLGPVIAIAEVLQWLRTKRPVQALVLSGAVLFVCAGASFTQIAVWHDNMSLWNHSIALVPGVPKAYDYLAKDYEVQGDLLTAEATFRRGLAVDPHDDLLVPDMGGLLAREHEPDEAIPYLAAAAAQSPNFLPYQNALTSALLAAGRDDEALAIMKRLWERHHSAELAVDLGTRLAKRGQLDEAEVWFNKALAQDPLNDPAEFNLGLLATERGQKAIAHAHFLTVAERSPNSDLGTQATQYLTNPPPAS